MTAVLEGTRRCANPACNREYAYAGRRCRGCHSFYHRYGYDREPKARVSSEPIIALIKHYGYCDIARRYVQRFGGEYTSVRRRLERTLYEGYPTVDLGWADEVCIALGYHPALVYGESWWAA